MKHSFLLLILVCVNWSLPAQKNINVIAYYSGGPEQVNSLPAGKLTHIIFSFGHLKDNQFLIGSHRDSTTIKNLADLKLKYPKLKVLLSLGGWGGCETCSTVFSAEDGRHEFALSVLQASNYFHTDGIDIDWEYPAIEGFPEHKFWPGDRNNFTSLLTDLRNTLGLHYEISFAAGGFQKFIDESIDWTDVVPLVDRINVMTYDLVNGNSVQTGHHTPLYSNDQQKESTDNAIQSLIRIGVPASKLVIGAAFYGRMWEKVPDVNNGIYQRGKFKRFIDYKTLQIEFIKKPGYKLFWDDKSMAPWIYNSATNQFITFDDKKSMSLKTRYAIKNQLNGIMFWELSGDSDKDGLLDEIAKVSKIKN